MYFVLALSAITAATVVYDRYGNPTDLTVTTAKRRYVARPMVGNPGPNNPQPQVRLGKVELRVDGNKIVGKAGELIADAGIISRQIFPHTPEKWDSAELLRSKGGIAIGNRVLWIFSWDAWEGMSEPSGEAFAIELLKGPDGSVKAGRSAEVRGLGSHIYFRGAVSFGHTLVMATYGLSIFDTHKWVEKEALADGEPCVAAPNRVYWDSNGEVFRYDPITGKLVLKASNDLGDLAFAYTVGKQDVLVFEHGMMNPDKRSSYRFPKGFSPNFFYQVDDVAIGFLSGALPSSEPGILLSPDRFTPVAMIHRAKPQIGN